MPIPTTKEELLDAITANYDKLYIELKNIPDELSDLKELEGHSKGTMMSVHNLLAYLIGWGQLVLKWNKMKTDSLPVDFPETDYKWNELGKLAQKFYIDYQEDNFQILIQKFDKTVKDLISLVKSKSDEELYVQGWYKKWTLGRMIQLNTASPYINARGRLRKWISKRQDQQL
jgi:hypothetical protein